MSVIFFKVQISSHKPVIVATTSSAESTDLTTASEENVDNPNSSQTFIELGMRNWPATFQINDCDWPSALKKALRDNVPLNKTLRTAMLDRIYESITESNTL